MVTHTAVLLYGWVTHSPTQYQQGVARERGEGLYGGAATISTRVPSGYCLDDSTFNELSTGNFVDAYECLGCKNDLKLFILYGPHFMASINSSWCGISAHALQT